MGAVDITDDGIKEIFIEDDIMFSALKVDFQKGSLSWIEHQAPNDAKQIYEGDSILPGKIFSGIPPSYDFSGDNIRYLIFDIDGDRNKELLLVKIHLESSDIDKGCSVERVYKWNGSVLASDKTLLESIEPFFNCYDPVDVLKGFTGNYCDDGEYLRYGWTNWRTKWDGKPHLFCIKRNYSIE